jgi:hypothetical protein
MKTTDIMMLIDRLEKERHFEKDTIKSLQWLAINTDELWSDLLEEELEDKQYDDAINTLKETIGNLIGD